MFFCRWHTLVCAHQVYISTGFVHRGCSSFAVSEHPRSCQRPLYCESVWSLTTFPSYELALELDKWDLFYVYSSGCLSAF